MTSDPQSTSYENLGVLQLQFSVRLPDIPVVTQRQVPTVPTFAVQVQLLGVVEVPVVVQRQVSGSMVQTTWVFRSCISSKVVDTPVVPQRLISMVQTVRFSSCISLIR